MSQSRSRARQRKQQREQQRRRNRQLTIVAVVVVAVVAVAGLFVVSNLPANAPIPEDVFERYDDFLQGTTPEGFYILGNPDAPAQVAEFSSFSCPACLEFHSNIFPQLLPRIERGEINFVYVPLQTAGNNAGGAARAALCAGEQDLFWEMHDVLFDWQSTFAGAAFTSQRLTAGAEALGLDVGEFNSCFNSPRINEVLTVAQAQGVTGTPTIQINGTTIDSNTAAIAAAIEQFGPFNDVAPGIVTDDAEDSETTNDTDTDADSGDADDTEMTEDTAADETTDTDADSDDTTSDDAEDDAMPEEDDETTDEGTEGDAEATEESSS